MPKKPRKSLNEQMTDSERRQYYNDQMAHAQKRLEEYRNAGNEKGEQRALEVINDIEFSIKLLEQRSRN